MTVSYAWRIEQMDTQPANDGLENVVCKIHWRLLASDDTSTADIYGDLNLCSPDPGNFVPYSELTEAAVIGWLETGIDALAAASQLDEGCKDSDCSLPSVEQLRSGLAGILAAKRSPAIVPMPLPWE